jgi:hypothetical protein
MMIITVFRMRTKLYLSMITKLQEENAQFRSKDLSSSTVGRIFVKLSTRDPELSAWILKSPYF